MMNSKPANKQYYKIFLVAEETIDYLFIENAQQENDAVE
jgi:hypothetical protein